MESSKGCLLRIRRTMAALGQRLLGVLPASPAESPPEDHVEGVIK